MTTVILDLDGVLFNAKPRIARHTKDGKTDWEAAYKDEEVAKDPVIAGAPANTRRIAKQFRVVYITGRDEICKQVTKDALDKNKFAKGRLCMRPRKDARGAEEVKREWIMKLPYLFVTAIDDCEDNKLCQMYTSLDIPYFLSFDAFFNSNIWTNSCLSVRDMV